MSNWSAFIIYNNNDYVHTHIVSMREISLETQTEPIIHRR